MSANQNRDRIVAVGRLAAGLGKDHFATYVPWAADKKNPGYFIVSQCFNDAINAILSEILSIQQVASAA